MQLSFAANHISIRQFDPIELPNFVVLTGRNGSGKTHLLGAIKAGNCQIDSFQPYEIQYFNFQSFTVPNANGPIPSSIEAMTALGFSEFQQNWLQPLIGIYQSSCAHWKPTRQHPEPSSFYQTVDDFWNAKFRTVSYQEHIESYRSELNKWIKEPNNIPRTSQFPAIWSVIHKSPVAPHLLNRDSFDGLFVPIQDAGSIIGFSLSTIFSKYKMDEYNWCHNEFSAGRSAQVQKSQALFRKKFEPPWVPINNLLDSMGRAAGSRDTFRFEVTTPEHSLIRAQHVQNFTFLAQLRNKSTGAICNFDQLSSGEKVLLALAISIHYANETFMLPRALLLDEVDASLHPSMIRTLLKAIENAFVANGSKVILATHSPTTVTLSADSSLFFVEAGQKPNKVRKTSKKEALALLSEGFLTFDEGLETLKFSGEKLVIFTEGHNRKILDQYLKLKNIVGVNFVDAIDSISSKEQLVQYYKLIFAIGLNRKSLFIWDCDAKNLVKNLDESEFLYKYVIPKNENNELASTGIENAFPANVFAGHLNTVTDPEGNVRKSFNSKHKARFTEKMAKSTNLADFVHFEGLATKIEALLSA
jgi:energy-coupling factor transporter ATP-binding protein EcfA2